jgi:hypothetical protein
VKEEKTGRFGQQRERNREFEVGHSELQLGLLNVGLSRPWRGGGDDDRGGRSIVAERMDDPYTR